MKGINIFINPNIVLNKSLIGLHLFSIELSFILSCLTLYYYIIHKAAWYKFNDFLSLQMQKTAAKYPALAIHHNNKILRISDWILNIIVIAILLYNRVYHGADRDFFILWLLSVITITIYFFATITTLKHAFNQRMKL